MFFLSKKVFTLYHRDLPIFPGGGKRFVAGAAAKDELMRRSKERREANYHTILSL